MGTDGTTIGLAQVAFDSSFGGASLVTNFFGTKGVVVALVTTFPGEGLLKIGRTRLSLVSTSFIFSVDLEISVGVELADIFKTW